jgi:hypothetical protein
VITSTSGWLRTASVTARPKRSRSTASALPAGTRDASAKRMIALPAMRSSSLITPTAFSSDEERNEFEQTSSA